MKRRIKTKLLFYGILFLSITATISTSIPSEQNNGYDNINENQEIFNVVDDEYICSCAHDDELPAHVITRERDLCANYSYPLPPHMQIYDREMPELFRNMTEEEIYDYINNLTKEEKEIFEQEMLEHEMRENERKNEILNRTVELNESFYYMDELTFEPMQTHTYKTHVNHLDESFVYRWLDISNQNANNNFLRDWGITNSGADGIAQEFIPMTNKISRITVKMSNPTAVRGVTIHLRLFMAADSGGMIRHFVNGGGALKRTVGKSTVSLGTTMQDFHFDFSPLDVSAGSKYYFIVTTTPENRDIRAYFSLPGQWNGITHEGYRGRDCRGLVKIRQWPYTWRGFPGYIVNYVGDFLFAVSMINNAPNKPVISGATTATYGTIYSFSMQTTDPEVDRIQFRFSIDGGATWSDWPATYHAHNAVITRTSFINSINPLEIRAQARDIHGGISAPSDIHTVNIQIEPPLITWIQTTSHWNPITTYGSVPFRVRVGHGNYYPIVNNHLLEIRYTIYDEKRGIITHDTGWFGSLEHGDYNTINFVKEHFGTLYYGHIDNVFTITAMVRDKTLNYLQRTITANILIRPNMPQIFTKSASDITSSSAKLNADLFCDGGLAASCYFRYGFFPQALDIQTPSSLLTTPPSVSPSRTLTSLTPSTNYYFRAYAQSVTGDNTPYNNPVSGDWFHFFTRPENPIWFTATKLQDGYVELDWGLPPSAHRGRILVRTPGSSSFEILYSGHPKHTYQTTDGIGTYTYRLYSIAQDVYGRWVDSSSYIERSVIITKPPELMTLNPIINERNFTLKGYLIDRGVLVGSADVRFEYGNSTSFGYNTTIQTFNTNDVYFNQFVTQLGFIGDPIEPGTIYVYRARGRNIDYGFHRSLSNTILFMTKPDPVSNPFVTFYPEELPAPDGNNLKSLITWGALDGVKGAYIEVEENAPPEPWNVGDGTPLNGIGYFNGTDVFHIGQKPNVTYYYKLWSFGKQTTNIEGNPVEFMSNGSELFPFGDPVQINFTTPNRPWPPTNLFLPRYGMYEIHLNWTKGFGADRTRIVAMDDDYPVNRDAGRIVYDGPGNYVIDFYEDFGDYSVQHYRAWSYNETNKLWSIAYDEVNTSVIDYQLFFPKYLNVGEYVISWGKIISQKGENVEGFITTTNVRDLKGNIVAGPVQWNCVDGNFQTTISTTEMIAGTYEIVSNFKNTLGTEFIYDFVSKLYLSKEGEELSSYYVRSNIHYTFYDVETGTGLDDDYYRVYISEDTKFSAADRIKGGVISTVLSTGNEIAVGKRYYMQIQDFNGNIIPIGSHSDGITTYNDGLIQNAYIGFDVTQTLVYVDLGVYLNQFRVKNMNESTVYMILRRMDGKAGQVLGRFIPPWGETEVFIPDGFYNLTIDYYDNNNPHWGPQKRIYPWKQNIFLDKDSFYHIRGYNLEDVTHEMIGDGVFIYYTIFDMNTGSKLEDNFYKIYFSKTTTFTERDRNMAGKYSVDLWNVVYYKIKDYWDNLIYPYDGSEYAQIVIESKTTYLDIGIPFNQFVITNQNTSLVYVRITNGPDFSPMNTWYNRWVPPHGSAELFLRTGTYNISVEYYYPHNGTMHSYRNIRNMSIGTDTMLNILGEDSVVFFNIFDTRTGLKPEYAELKIYVDGVRIPNKLLYTSMGRTINVTVKDYFDNILYSENIEVSETFTYIDIPLELFSLKFSNFNRDFFVTSIKKNQSAIWVERIVTPYEAIEYVITRGNYSVRIYNSTLNVAEFYVDIDKSIAYVITGDDINKSVNLAIYGQNVSIALSLREMEETYNLSNELLRYYISHLPYRNESLISLKDEFRNPHIFTIPVLKEKYEDKLPPVTSLTATVTVDGGIRVRWVSTDDRGESVDYVELFYKEDNATWREWDNTTSRIGNKVLTEDEIELVEGRNYTFMALGTDYAGNVEKPSTINTATIMYSLIDIDITPTRGGDILGDIFTNWLFIVALISIAGSILLLFLIEKKRNKEEMEEEMVIPYERM